jgi:hypothetical protein
MCRRQRTGGLNQPHKFFISYSLALDIIYISSFLVQGSIKHICVALHNASDAASADATNHYGKSQLPQVGKILCKGLKRTLVNCFAVCLKTAYEI